MVRYRSKFEKEIITNLPKKIKFFYEYKKINYVQPAILRTYLPDLYFPHTNIFVELKGRFTLADRKKHLYLQSMGDYDIRICFQNAKVKINKNSKTTYADWCTKYKIKFCDKVIPKGWMTKNGKW